MTLKRESQDLFAKPPLAATSTTRKLRPEYTLEQCKRELDLLRELRLRGIIIGEGDSGFAERTELVRAAIQHYKLADVHCLFGRSYAKAFELTYGEPL